MKISLDRETGRPGLFAPIWTASVVIEGEDALARVLVPLPSMRCIRQFRVCSGRNTLRQLSAAPEGGRQQDQQRENLEPAQKHGDRQDPFCLGFKPGVVLGYRAEPRAKIV